MARQTQVQRPQPKPQPTTPTDAPTTNKRIARLWFGQ
jgi:hypothetical protein